jgi:YHS domain-containing protein
MRNLFIIFTVLLSVGLIMGCGEKKEEAATEKPAEVKMVKDVVCGMDVDPSKTTITAEYDGKTYYFCAEECKEKFLEKPAEYAMAAEHDHEHGEGTDQTQEQKEGEEHKH